MSEPTTLQIHPDVRPYLDTIADRLLSGHAAVMVGAGFSRNAVPPGSGPAFPNWFQLGDRFYGRLHGRKPEPDRNYLQVPALAHEVDAAFGRPALNQMLRDEIPDLQHPPSPLHVKLLDLPWSDIFTTNYDTLLERACRSIISQRYDVVVKPEDLGHSKRPRIFKLHGSFPSHLPFIVTDEDYRRYPQAFAPFVNTVRQALLENTLCLIGFSGDDPNFLQWIGWIHDNLGHEGSPKMYLIGLLRLSHSQKTLIERRNIIPVDMSECPGVDDDHYRALETFIDHLRSGQAKDNRLDWPSSGDDDNPPRNDDLPAVVATWKSQRCRYPGWVVLPEDRRLALWRKTRGWIRKLLNDGKLPGALDIEFAFELIWRLEKCLCPIFDNQVGFLEATVTRYWPVTAAGFSFASLSLDANDMRTRELTEDDVRQKCHYLLLAMMRYYREEGLSDKWQDGRKRIQTVVETLSPENTARLRYEQALFGMFTLNLPELRAQLAEWPQDDAPPFWGAKKAGLLAEIGEVDEAQRILEQSLEAIRMKLNLTPTRTDYGLVSQEAFVMFLLHAVRQRSLFADPDSSHIRRQRREFRERWHSLRQYKCDPWQEVETFTHKLDRRPVEKSHVTEKPTFGIGRRVRTRHFGGQENEEALTAYSFLRFCEDASIPFRIPGCTLATKSAAGTLSRIAGYSSYWALVTLLRIGDADAVDEIFDRTSLARMDTEAVDSLVDRYLESLRAAFPEIEVGDWRNENFGTPLAKVVPEILSRLCCKCSRGARDKLLDLLLEIYQSEHRWKFKGIAHLAELLLQALPVHERIDAIPRLLQFPILDVAGSIEEREYENPFVFFSVERERVQGAPAIADGILDVFFERAASDASAVREWAVTTLGKLHDLGLLGPAESKRFGSVLWSRTGEDGMPMSTDYYRHAFLNLPHPTEVDPVALFMEYVRRARFPAQESGTSTPIGLGGHTDVPLCNEIIGAKGVPWTDEDVRTIVRRLVEWWDADKEHSRRPDVPGLFPSVADAVKDRLSELVDTLGAMVTRHSGSLADENIRNAVKRVMEEQVEYGLPALRLEMACVSLFPGWRERILRRVEEALAATGEEVVMDALGAIRVLSEGLAADTEASDVAKQGLMTLLRAASQKVFWRNTVVPSATMRTLADVVGRHPWTFADDVEKSALLSLARLIGETTIQGGDGARDKMDRADQDVWMKLLIRCTAARLAYRLFEHYRGRGDAVPKAIATWEEVCRSDDEFAEVRNQWIGSRSGISGSPPPDR